MQIHELNNFSGALGSGAYLAIDDGNDTGKISSQGLLAATEARIDNIIAGPAPSAEEIVDARLGADGVTYSSLGTAIRTQFSNVENAFSNFAEYITNSGLYAFLPDLEQGNIQNGSDSSYQSAARVRSGFIESSNTNYIAIKQSDKTWRTYISFYDANKSFVLQQDTRDTEFYVTSQYPYYRLVFIDITGGSYTNPITPNDVYKDYVFCTDSLIHKLKLSELFVNATYIAFLQNKVINSSGDIADKNYRVASQDYIDIENNSIIVKNNNHAYRTYIYYYDSEKTYISSANYISTYNNDLSIILDDVPNNATYYRVAVLDYINSGFENPISAQDVQDSYLIFKINPLLERALDSINLEYPSYFDSQMSAVTSDIIEHNGSVGLDGYSFIFCTDIHWDQNEKHSPALIEHIAKTSFIDLTILGGDYISQFASSKQTAIDTMRKCMSKFREATTELYPIFGNHDRNSNGSSTPSSVYLTKAETYSIINAWMLQRAKYADEYFDFYLDDNKSKTRFICLDTGAQNIDGGVIDASSLAWCESVIDALPNDWHIIIVAHWLFSVTTWNQPLVNDVLTGSYTQSAQTLFAMLDSINADNTKAKVEAIITGHVHCDYNDSTANGIPIIYTDTDSLGAYGNYTATVGTVSEQCFDTITIDYTNKIIYCDRVGRGVSREISY